MCPLLMQEVTMKHSQITEIVVFKVKNEFINQLPNIRDQFKKALADFSGIRSIENLSPINNDRIFADIIQWDTLTNAQIVAKAFDDGDERFLPMIQAIDEMSFMGHFINTQG